MANYNSGRLYNRLMTDGGANYNSGSFMIMVLDSGYGIDHVASLAASVSVSDNGIAGDGILLIASIEVLDQSSTSSDTVSVTGNVEITDFANGIDEVLPIRANVHISDLGAGQEHVGVAGAFFVVDGKNILQPLGVLISRDSRYELLPATRDNTEEIPGRHGELDFGTELKSRLLELHASTKRGLPVEKAQMQRLFAKYLDPTQGYKNLIFSDDIDKTYKVKYSGQIDLAQYATWFQFVIPFKMTDPIIMGTFEKMLNGSGALANDGTFETGLIVEISGLATNPSLTLGGETLSYTGTIPAGQTLVIDTEKQTAKIGTTNAIGNYNGAFPTLKPGSASVTAGSNVVIRWRDRWI